MIGIDLDKSIESMVDEILLKGEMPDVEYVETDNFGEALEKLIIVHIRTWMLEDAIQEAKNNDEIADLKKKIDICFKQKRPKLVQALNILVDNAISHNKSLKEDSVKLYKGVE